MTMRGERMQPPQGVLSTGRQEPHKKPSVATNTFASVGSGEDESQIMEPVVVFRVILICRRVF